MRASISLASFLFFSTKQCLRPFNQTPAFPSIQRNQTPEFHKSSLSTSQNTKLFQHSPSLSSLFSLSPGNLLILFSPTNPHLLPHYLTSQDNAAFSKTYPSPALALRHRPKPPTLTARSSTPTTMSTLSTCGSMMGTEQRVTSCSVCLRSNS